MNTRADAVGVTMENVVKKYGQTTALRDFGLVVEPGEMVVLLGPSGCGKTTALRCLAGLESVNGGRILVGDRDITHVPVQKREMAMVFQSYSLFPHLNALDNVAFGLRNKKVGKSAARTQAQEALELVGLADQVGKYVHQMSGGQQQRVALARALAVKPQVLLLDEPLSNLDARLRRRVRTEIRELQQRLQFTAVYVTHDQDEALAVSDRIVVMKDGRIAQEGSPRDLYERPASSFIADFIGEANVIPCEILAVSGAEATVSIGGLRHVVPALKAKPGRGKLAVRPSAITVEPSNQGALPGRIRHAAYLGDHIEYEAETADGTLFIVDPSVDRLLSAGTEVSIGLKTRGIAIIAE